MSGETAMTSQTHPLQIAELAIAGLPGKIGITLCPGKKVYSFLASREWDRDLASDLDTIMMWGAGAVVTLLESHEFEELQVRQLPQKVREIGAAWFHLPIQDVSIPDQLFSESWPESANALFEILKSGKHVLIHCRGGIGRAGTVAALLLQETGENAWEAINQVRAVRPGAIETFEQEEYVLGYTRVCGDKFLIS